MAPLCILAIPVTVEQPRFVNGGKARMEGVGGGNPLPPMVGRFPPKFVYETGIFCTLDTIIRGSLCTGIDQFPILFFFFHSFPNETFPFFSFLFPFFRLLKNTPKGMFSNFGYFTSIKLPWKWNAWKKKLFSVFTHTKKQSNDMKIENKVKIISFVFFFLYLFFLSKMRNKIGNKLRREGAETTVMAKWITPLDSCS